MNLFKDIKFLKVTATIAVPVTIQQVLTTITNIVDTMMIGQLGTVAISAVGLANKLYFAFSLIVLGVHSGTGILMSQFFGSGDYHHIRKTFGIGLIINLCVGLLFWVAGYFSSESVMRIFTNNPETIDLGATYLHAVSFCYPMLALTSIMVSFLKSTRKLKVTVVAAVMSICTNIFLNYVLIFGHFGVSALGVFGAAVATVIARLAECLILVYFCFFRDKILSGKLPEFFGWSKSFLHNFTSHSMPVIFNESVWGFGTMMYSVAYGRISNEAVAAITICETISNVLETTGIGISSATSVMLGNELGAGNLKKAEDYASKFLQLGVLTGIMSSVLLILFHTELLSLFSVTDEVRILTEKCVYVLAAIYPFVYVVFILIVGVLRSGGDTRACFIIDVAGVWLWSVPMAFLGGLCWKLPVYFVYALVNLEQVLKVAAAYPRYRKKIWLKNLSKEI